MQHLKAPTIITFDQKLVNTFNLLKGNQIQQTLFTRKIHKSVNNLIFSHRRAVVTKSVQNKKKHSALEISQPIEHFEQCIKLVEMLSDFSLSPSEFFDDKACYKVPPILSVTTIQQNIRSAFTCNQMVSLMKRLTEGREENPEQQNEICKANDLQEMSPNCKVFIGYL